MEQLAQGNELPAAPVIDLSGDERALLSRFYTAEAFAKEGSRQYVEWIVKPFLAAGAITAIAGRPKEAGKTTLALHMIRAVLTGDNFLSTPAVRTPVVYLSEESATFNLAMRRAGIQGANDMHISTRCDLAGCSWPVICRVLRAKCREAGAKLAVVDTLAQFADFADGQEQDSAAMQRAIKQLQPLADDGVAVVLVVHERKDGGSRTTGIRGSNALVAAVDWVVSVRATGRGDSNVRTLRFAGRLGESGEAAEMLIELTPSGYVQTATRSESAGPRRGRASEAPRKLPLPADAPSAKTVRELARAWKTSESTANRLLGQMQIAVVGSGRKGDPKRYYRAMASGRLMVRQSASPSAAAL